MPGQTSKKRKLADGRKGKSQRPAKKFKKQTDYHSTSEDEPDTTTEIPTKSISRSADADDVGESPGEEDTLIKHKITKCDPKPAAAHGDATDSDGSFDEQNGEDEGSDPTDNGSDASDDEEGRGNPNIKKKRKRNDPAAFATSLSKILNSKLSTSKRADPVLSRSVTALQASTEIAELALEKKARHKLREEKRAAMDKDRTKDVLGASTAFDAAHGFREGQVVLSVQQTMGLEKRLRKTAQRGVVKLFNAVRAAQVKGEEAARKARAQGVVGQGRREENTTEMSKKGFLELIAGSGGGLRAGEIAEA